MRLILLYMFRAAVLLMAAEFGSLFADNILELRRLDTLRRVAEAEVISLRRENDALLAESKALDQDAFYIELTLRRKLRWIRPGEQQLDIAPHKNPSCNPAIQMAGDEKKKAEG